LPNHAAAGAPHRQRRDRKEKDVAQKRRQKPSTGPNLKPFYIALAAVAVAGIAWIGYSLSTGGGSTATAPIQLAGMEDPQALVSSARGITVGRPDAPVPVLVFSDFTCPSCQQFAAAIEGLIKSEYVEKGLVRYTYYDWPIGGEGQHRHAFIAARAGRCAEAQGRFWEYHDVVFGRQGEWVYARTPPIDELVEYAGQIGLNVQTFEQCLRSEEFADVVSASRLLGERYGVNGTPTVYVGTRLVPNWGDWNGIKTLIESALPPGARGRALNPAGDTALTDTSAAPGA
jgi:protein-disulfide isomerase